MSFQLHPRLKEDCHFLGQCDGGHLLLHRNATVPWLILVPETEQHEIYLLSEEQQQRVNHCVNQLAHFSQQTFKCDKLNIATIGNVVPQLHIHIISRFKDDIWWPEPVWGKTENRAYSQKEVETMQQSLLDAALITPL